MNNQPQVPEQTTIDRHVTKMSELCRRMDRHIADLEELNTRLDEEFYKSPYGMYRKKKQTFVSN
jgi:uncharacterized membrane protein YjjP (DUF1212 family)